MLRDAFIGLLALASLGAVVFLLYWVLNAAILVHR